MSGSMMGSRKISGGMLGGKKLAGGMLGGKSLWATAAAGIAGVYGTGLGQVPMAYYAEDPTVSGTTVTAWKNKGGAGPVFDLAPRGGGPGITRSSAGAPVATVTGGAFLALANPADHIGVRLFAVAAWPEFAAQTGIARGFVNGVTTAIRLNSTTSLLAAINPNPPPNVTITVPAGTLANGNKYLVEVEMTAGTIRLIINGKSIGAAAHSFSSYYMDKLFAVDNNYATAARAYCVLSRVTDGSAAMDAGNAAIRQELAARYGVSLS